MPASAVASTFDVVVWFTDRALNDGEYLQPTKLHRLMFLAQGYFAVAFRGQKLMPATFVAEPSGPVEPDVWRVYASGRPYIESVPPPERIEQFLDSIWRRFGSHSADYLGDLIGRQPPFQAALAEGPRTEIPLAEVAAFLARPPAAAKGRGPQPGVEEVLRPRTALSATGKAVSVRRWTPGGSKPGS